MKTLLYNTKVKIRVSPEEPLMPENDEKCSATGIVASFVLETIGICLDFLILRNK